MQVKVEKQKKSTVKLEITIPNEEVKKAYDKVVTQVVDTAEIEGFRKGKAPKEKVLEKTDTSKLYGEVVNELLQTYYPQALKEHHIQPVANPRVEIKEFDLEKDFEFVATVATRPEVKIGDYKAEIKKVYEEKEKALKTQNAAKLKAGEKITADHVHLAPEEIVNAIINVTDAEISDVLIQEETDRMLTRLVDQAQSVGLSLEQYLQSQSKTADDLRKEYSIEAEKTLKAEFAMGQLVQDEKIEVSDSDVNAALLASGINPDQSEQSETQKWYIRSILEKNQLINKLLEEVEGENAHHDHSHDKTNKDENDDEEDIVISKK